MIKPKKSYKKGGKVVAQGADKSDVRSERKQDRAKKQAVKALKKAKNKGDRNFKRDVKSGKLTPIGKNLVRINESKKK